MASYAHAHIVFRMGGHFGASADQKDHWSAGLRLAVVGADVFYSESALQTFVTSLATPAAQYHTASGVNAGSTTYLDWLTAARVGQDGKYLPDTQDTVRHDFGTPVPSTGGTGAPWSQAHVVSLRTDRPRGRGSNGRFYYPAIGISCDPGTGRIVGTSVTNKVNSTKTFFDAINTSAAAYATNMAICVVSSVGQLEARVTSIRADDRMDAIERRENSQPSVWKTAALA